MSLVYAEALDVYIQYQDITFREYLKRLLTALWLKGELFSGKRPFGDSGWQFDVYSTLIREGFIEGELDENGHVDTMDTEKADQFILKCIDEVFAC